MKRDLKKNLYINKYFEPDHLYFYIMFDPHGLKVYMIADHFYLTDLKAW